ncbi:hypothetical protein GCM10007216_39140 [Thalassobacillus devorans]|uniref:Diguanylate cyclase (GGDEF)-like protein n=1 Tax=Thalassobacillus devorans TaxID=279813 RepID=A0ABQ1PV96_9BACI|nr:bifunctional diguanylate cyclase/phosphodiesterase [Thalassobacillus devorans]NIK30839.1 diguanylate cyclase (GGDEF)-like protein [Thalassobacillus devorans]GGD04687.1 hypothetical protein GCM10007216_39140 [Thalassobacillus devorans]
MDNLDTSFVHAEINRLMETLKLQLQGGKERQTLKELDKLLHNYLTFYDDLAFTESKVMEETLAIEVENDFQRTVAALMNMVFKVRKNKNGNYYFTMYEGKLARSLGLTTAFVEGKEMDEIFGLEKAGYLTKKYDKAFAGENVTYKHKLKDTFLYSTLAPIQHEGEVVEIIGSSVDITVHAEAEMRVRHMAYHDPLTDLPNRRKLQKDLEERLTSTDKQKGTPFYILLCDLDRFKYINDALGHTAGDEVIQLIGRRIREVISEKGKLYRLGSDEFVVITDQASSEKDARKLGNSILEQVSKPLRIKGKELFLTTSIGIAGYSGGGTTAGKLIGNADIAMHYCKLKGRQSLLFYSDSMNKSYNELVSLEGELRAAIRNKELLLYYQPKIDVRSGVISGMEALVRWKHPVQGFISPGKFIPIAEETGLILKLGEWVLFEACRQNKEWMEKGYAPERVAVNVSAEEIQRHDFASRVEKILEETGMPARFLEIEITENSIMQNTDACIQTMQELKRQGIALSIDDFGTGYSSLGYLRQFPINYLKIDQSFIKDVSTNPSGAEIVKAMIQLAHTFKLEVIGEGVEKPMVLGFLKENGCDHYQGYHFSKPLPPEEFENFLTQRNHYTFHTNK